MADQAKATTRTRFVSKQKVRRENRGVGGDRKKLKVPEASVE